MSNKEALVAADAPIATPASIICAALEPGLKGGIAQNRTARVLDALTKAGWSFVAPDDAVRIGRELDTLRDLAHVLDAQIEEGVILPDGMGLVIAALARIHPDRVHTGARCQAPECLVHGPCDECPTEAQWARLDGLLTTWLAEHPREAVIHKTASVGRSDQLPDLHPWQPAGAYPIDGTIIEVEGRGRMRYCLDKTSAYCANHQLGGWLVDAAAPEGHWATTERPTTRWRKAPPVRV